MTQKKIIALMVVVVMVASAAFAALPAAVIAPHLRLPPETFYLPLALNLVFGFLLS